jgi:hypothetical protein
MKHLLERKEWIRINESFFSEGAPFAKDKAKAIEIMDKLVNEKGYSVKLAAALVGNMFKESVFDPKAIGRDSKGNEFVGLVQWGGGRKDKLKKKPNWNTIGVQVDFIDEELSGAYSKVKAVIEAQATVEAAAEMVGRKYEVCADPTSPKRIKGAREIYDMYMEKLSAFTPPTLTDDDFTDQPPIEGQ